MKIDTNKYMKPYKKYFKESSWSRIIQHIISGNSFGVISAYLLDASEEENKKRHKDLRNDIRKIGYGYIEQDSGYTYKNKETNEEITVDEQSFFIPMITKKDALLLCKNYKQYSILFKDDTGFYEIKSDGTIENKFKTKRDSKTGQITFDPKELKLAYSKLKKGTLHQMKQIFSYVKECVWIKELKIPTRYEGIRTGKIPEARYEKIL